MLNERIRTQTKRRANILSGLINNWEKAEEVRNKALNSSEEAEKSQQKLLETSNGQIELMAGNWQIFVDNIVDSDAVLNALTFINKALKDINDEMEINKKISDDEAFGLSGITEQAKINAVGAGGMDLMRIMFGKTKEELKTEYNDLMEGMSDSTVSELSSLKSDLMPLQERYNSLTTSIKQNKEMLHEQRFASEGNKEEVAATTKAIANQKEELRNILVELSQYGIIGSDVATVIAEIESNASNLTDGMDKQGTAMKDNRTIAEKYYDDLKDLNSDATKEMIGNWDNLSEAQQQNLINVATVAVREKKKEITERLNNINTIKAELTALLQYQKVMDDEISKKLLPGFGMGGEEDAVESLKSAGRQKILNAQMAIDLAIQSLNKSESTLDDLLTRGDGDGTGGGSTSSPLSQLAMDIKEIQHEISLLDDELGRTDSYSKQIEITKKLIGWKEKEKVKLIKLRDEQEQEYKSLEEGKKPRQDAIADYYDTVEALGKLENDIYGYEESIISLGETQTEALEKSTSETVSKLRDDYSKMFEDLKEGYQDDADDFEKKQEEKIRAVEKSIDKLKDKYDSEDFVDEEEKIQDKILALEEERQKLSIDNSLAAKKRKYDIGNELEVEQENLANLKQDRERTLTIDGLEDKKEAYEEETRIYEEELDEKLKDLENFEDSIMDNLDSFKDDWSNFGTGIGTAFEDGLLPSLETINAELAKTIASYNEVTGADVKLPSTDRSASGGSSDSVNRGTETRYVDSSGNVQTGYIKDGKTTTSDGGDIPIGSVVETEGGNYLKTKTGSKLANNIDIDDYVKHDGGVVGGQSFAGNGFMDYMSNLAGNEMPIIAEQGEVVLKESQIGALAGGQGNTAKFDSLISINNPQIGGNYNDISDFSKKLATETNQQLAKLGIVNIGRN